MKKQYIIPALNIIKVQAQAHMLFGSPTGENTANGGGNQGDFDPNNHTQLSRGLIWELEEVSEEN